MKASAFPDHHGHFGSYGGRYVAETLMPLILEVEQAYQKARNDASFHNELSAYQRDYIGRPSALWEARRFSTHVGGARIFFKRDELNHTGSHKINNCFGQILLAMRMGKRRIVAETGAGMHGVATATAAALMDLECIVYMGAKDINRQAVNVQKMRLLGAKVIPCTNGASGLKEAMNEALRDWVSNVTDTYYLIGSTAGPHPYPMMVRDFQSIIGEELVEQIHQKTGKNPDCLVAAVGGGSNALGLFTAFLHNKNVAMFGVEAGGKGLDGNMHGAALTKGVPGVLHGSRSYYLQDDHGQILEAHSISAGLDYPGVGPEHACLKDSGRVQYVAVTDDDALYALKLCSRLEGIIPALEPAHALAFVIQHAATMPKESIVVANLCGRGDKDMDTIAKALGWNDTDQPS